VASSGSVIYGQSTGFDMNPEQIEVEILLASLDEKPHSFESELDEMWSYVARKSNPRWL